MIRDQKAFNKAQEEDRRKLEDRIAAAAENLPAIVAKNKGVLCADSRAEVYATLISEGVLGGKWIARHIAHAVKHRKPLPVHHQELAGKIITNALQRVEAAGHIVIQDDAPSKFELRIPHTANETASDPDERYLVSQLIPRQRAAHWNLQSAHD